MRPKVCKAIFHAHARGALTLPVTSRAQGGARGGALIAAHYPLATTTATSARAKMKKKKDTANDKAQKKTEERKKKTKTRTEMSEQEAATANGDWQLGQRLPLRRYMLFMRYTHTHTNTCLCVCICRHTYILQQAGKYEKNE